LHFLLIGPPPLSFLPPFSLTEQNPFLGNSFNESPCFSSLIGVVFEVAGDCDLLTFEGSEDSAEYVGIERLAVLIQLDADFCPFLILVHIPPPYFVVAKTKSILPI
jgi:hypothetical protein